MLVDMNNNLFCGKEVAIVVDVRYFVVVQIVSVFVLLVFEFFDLLSLSVRTNCAGAWREYEFGVAQDPQHLHSSYEAC